MKRLGIFLRFVGLLGCLTLSHSLSAQGLVTPSGKVLPAEAERILSALPGRTLTVDFVLKKAMASSDSFKEIRSREPILAALKFREEALTDPRLQVSLNRIDDARQPNNPFGLVRNQQWGATAGLHKAFLTGTEVGVELFKGKTEITMPPQFAIGGTGLFQAFETRATLSITQELWKNFLGEATRASRDALALQSKGAEAAMKSSAEKWAMDLIGLYYSGWFLQSNLRELDKQTLRRKRLLGILQLRARRGTSEPSDVHQIEAAVESLEVSRREVEQKLNEIWRNLVISLKLPEVFLSIHPREVPLVLDQPDILARDKCLANQKLSDPQDILSSHQVVVSEAEFAAAQSEVASASSLMRPQVQIGGQLGRNGVDYLDERNSSTRFLEGAGTMWAVSLQFAMPLGRDLEKAQLAEALANKMQTEARLQVVRDQDMVRKHNLCSDLERLLDARARLAIANQSQKKRVQLDEERFRIARIPAFQVIQSEDEAMGTEIAALQIETSLRSTAWAILETGREIHRHLERLSASP
ncbi:MAG: TolC family protein [Bdellovibrionales bacterium]|nr:TolC family protein [Bdellovibrionales bacterium]